MAGVGVLAHRTDLVLSHFKVCDGLFRLNQSLWFIYLVFTRGQNIITVFPTLCGGNCIKFSLTQEIKLFFSIARGVLVKKTEEILYYIVC